MARATFSGNSNYQLDVQTALHSQSAAGNYSTIAYHVRAYKTWGSGFWGSGSGTADSNIGRLWSDSFSFDFTQVPVGGFLTLASGTFRVPHNSSGIGPAYWAAANVTLGSLGSAYVRVPSVAPPSLAKAPPAPVDLRLDQLTETSVRFRFSSNGTGGSPVTGWQIGYGLSPTTPQFFMASSGTSIVDDLTPGSTWYLWARGKNSFGWGPWSKRVHANTPPGGVRIKIGGVWKIGVPYVKVNGVWKIAVPYVKVNGVWKIPG